MTDDDARGDELRMTPCPACGQLTLDIEMRLLAKPLGTYSLSGRQMKFSAYEWPYLFCRSCGISAPAKRDQV